MRDCTAPSSCMVVHRHPVEHMTHHLAFAFAQVRKHKWDNYSSGEELFGLPVTKYPELEKTEKEVAMLDRLYT